jgi:hypothetical protein
MELKPTIKLSPEGTLQQAHVSAPLRGDAGTQSPIAPALETMGDL